MCPCSSAEAQLSFAVPHSPGTLLDSCSASATASISSVDNSEEMNGEFKDDILVLHLDVDKYELLR